MKKIVFIVFVCFLFVSNAQDLFVGSYNIRCVMHSDKKCGDIWEVRGEKLCQQILFLEPDVFGTQEASDKQLKQMDEWLKEYAHVGVGRDDGKKKGEHSAIFYNKTKYELLDKGNFWLNSQPDKPIVGWDASKVRICSWAKLKDKDNGFEFYFFNLHLDHRGEQSKQKSAFLVVEKIKEIANNKPFILTGDFNSEDTSISYKIFKESGLMFDSYITAEDKFSENGTYMAFDPERKSQRRIDYIFVSKHFNVRKYAVLTDTYWTENKDKKTKEQRPYIQRTFSDHYPIFAKLRYSDNKR